MVSGSRRILLPALIAALVTGGGVALFPRFYPAFQPELESLQFAARKVRPGDSLAYAILFRNEGRGPGASEDQVFVHFESIESGCRDVSFADDHAPRTSTLHWPAGMITVDGPRVVAVPADVPEGTYRVHAGLRDPERGTLRVDAEAGIIRVHADAKHLAEGDAQPVLERFGPILLNVNFEEREARPGDSLAYSIDFMNVGASPARDDHHVFVHIERSDEGCSSAVVQDDHAPMESTRFWPTGRVVMDGPYALRIPSETPEGEYDVHVGVYAPTLSNWRLATGSGGVVRVGADVPVASGRQASLMAAEEAARRETALTTRFSDPVHLEGSAFRFTLDRESGGFLLTDRESGVAWSSDPRRAGFIQVGLNRGGEMTLVAMASFDEIELEPDRLRAEAALRIDGAEASGLFRLIATETAPRSGLRLAYEVVLPPDWKLEFVRLIDHGLFTTDADEGYVVVPRYVGQLLAIGDTRFGDRRYGTYDQLSMAMYGAVRRGSALLVAWDSLRVDLLTHFSTARSSLIPGWRLRSSTFALRGEQNAIELYPLGLGDYVDIALAYREIAERRGLRDTKLAKRARNPRAGLLSGAAQFKPCLLNRLQPGAPYNDSAEEVVHLRYTFDEVARDAEHWRKTLEIDRALVMLAGWNYAGYDNQLPRVLPACPEAGGDEGLADCARRVRDCGFLFGLHDNYQDMYPDSPDWDEAVLNRGAEGFSKGSGVWSGGASRLVCSSQQADIARRNLPLVRELCRPDIHFLDAAFAWGLVTCEAPAHPMNRADDLRSKLDLCAAVVDEIGLVGVEGGREVAVPVAEYFDGLISIKTRAVEAHPVVPLFSMVFGDCVNLYTAQAYHERVGPEDAAMVLDHVLYAEMPLYHIEDHLYFEGPSTPTLPLRPELADFRKAGPSRVEVSYRWNVDGDVAGDFQCFVNLVGGRDGETVVFGDVITPEKRTSQWRTGDAVVLGPRTIDLPGDGEWTLLCGMLDGKQRLRLRSGADEGLAYALGTVRAEDGQVEFDPAPWRASPRTFTRADGGWAEGLNDADRFIKNTWEVLSWLDRRTADTPMSDHAFLSEDRSVERSRFGDVVITVNQGVAPFRVGETVLPRYGFLVESPTYVAFHATRRGGIDYPSGALFTLRSLDGLPLDQSAEVRIFHGFGHGTVALAGKHFVVTREAVVSAR